LKKNNNIQGIGKGLYTIPEVSMILQLPQAKVHRWLKDYYDGQLVQSLKSAYSWRVKDHKMVNFLTMIEFYVFYKLREQHISPAKILAAHAHLSSFLKTAYPFASHELLINGKSIIYQQTDDIWVEADRSNQIVFYDMLNAFSVKIDFSATCLAERFWPLGRNRAVVVDPHHQFGQPVLNGTNINTTTIFEMYESGEKISTIGLLYDLSEKQIRDAIEFSNRSAA